MPFTPLTYKQGTGKTYVTEIVMMYDIPWFGDRGKDKILQLRYSAMAAGIPFPFGEEVTAEHLWHHMAAGRPFD